MRPGFPRAAVLSVNTPHPARECLGFKCGVSPLLFCTDHSSRAGGCKGQGKNMVVGEAGLRLLGEGVRVLWHFVWVFERIW